MGPGGTPPGALVLEPVEAAGHGKGNKVKKRGAGRRKRKHKMRKGETRREGCRGGGENWGREGALSVAVSLPASGLRANFHVPFRLIGSFFQTPLTVDSVHTPSALW